MPQVAAVKRVGSGWFGFDPPTDFVPALKKALAAAAALGGYEMAQYVGGHDWGPDWNALAGGIASVVAGFLMQYIPPTSKTLVLDKGGKPL